MRIGPLREDARLGTRLFEVAWSADGIFPNTNLVRGGPIDIVRVKVITASELRLGLSPLTVRWAASDAIIVLGTKRLDEGADHP